MPAAKRALRKCPKCGRQFANRDQWHGCTSLTVADCLKGKSKKTIQLFKAFHAAVRACGPSRVHSTKTRIAFIARKTFAGAILKKDAIEAGFILPYRARSRRFVKFFPYAHGGGHFLRIDNVKEIDDEVRQWLAEAYQVGKQESPKFDPIRIALARRRLPTGPVNSRPRTGKVFYLHWNEEELSERSAALRAAGHDVRGHWDTVTTPKWGDWFPDVAVISLDRLPSHGRAYAGWFWEAKKRQHVPLVFAGGQPDKVATTKSLFPKAIFCATDEVPKIVGRVMRQLQ